MRYPAGWTPTDPQERERVERVERRTGERRYVLAAPVKTEPVYDARGREVGRRLTDRRSMLIFDRRGTGTDRRQAHAHDATRDVFGDPIGGATPETREGLVERVENIVVSTLAAEYRYAEAPALVEEPDSREVTTRILRAIADELECHPEVSDHGNGALHVADYLRTEAAR